MGFGFGAETALSPFALGLMTCMIVLGFEELSLIEGFKSNSSHKKRTIPKLHKSEIVLRTGNGEEDAG